MTDNLSTEDRRRTMRAVKGKGTAIERQLWAMLAGMGLRGWRKNPKDMTGNPDAAFTTEQVAIFVDGCFWHGCPWCNRKLPETNREYWVGKIGRNVERDGQNTQELTDEGWFVIRIWGHTIRDPASRGSIRPMIRNALEREQELL